MVVNYPSMSSVDFGVPDLCFLIETREKFELEKVVSWGNGDHRWRTKLHLGSGEPLNDDHWSSTLGAEPKITGVLGA